MRRVIRSITPRRRISGEYVEKIWRRSSSGLSAVFFSENGQACNSQRRLCEGGSEAHWERAHTSAKVVSNRIFSTASWTSLQTCFKPQPSGSAQWYPRSESHWPQEESVMRWSATRNTSPTEISDGWRVSLQ